MKQVTFAPILILMSLLSFQTAAASSLAGNYSVQSANCLNGGLSSAAIPLEIKVQADSRGVEYFLLVNVAGYTNALEDVMHGSIMGVGTTTNHVMGDGFFRTVGKYSNGGNEFTYTELENSDSYPAFVKLRSTTLVLQGNELQISEQEEGASPRVCVLIKN